MATGDILSCSVNANGWTIDITIEGQGISGTYDPGLGVNNDPTNSKIKIYCTEPGFTDIGGITTVSKTVYCTGSLRKPYPDESTKQEIVSGSDIILTVKLSDFIGSGATLITADVLSGFYTDTVSNNQVLGLSVTNNSTATYGKVIANWSYPGNSQIVDSLQLKAVAFHRSATEGDSVKAVKFILTDESLNTVTKIITTTTPTIESVTGICIEEYIANFDSVELSTLTAEEDISCDFIAYPIVGNSSSILDTSDLAHTSADWRYKTQINYYDPLEAYDKIYAVVDPISGNDLTGVASSTFSTADSNRFATIFTSIREIRDVNNGNGRNNASNGVVYLVDGEHEWAGGNVFTPTDNLEKVWLNIIPYPGESKSTVSAVPSSDSGDRYTVSKYVKVSDISFSRSISAYWFRNNITDGEIWVEDCDIDTSGANYFAWQLGYDVRSITNCSWVLTEALVIGADLLRGSSFTGAGDIEYATNFLGNSFSCGVSEESNQITDSTNSGDSVDGAIIAFNKFLNQNNTIISIGQYALTHGMAIIQNILERAIEGTGTYPAMIFYASNPVGIPNILKWYNTVAGQRENMSYNSTGTVSVDFVNWSERGNIDLYRAYKSDLFAPASGNRIGNWPCGFQVSGYGNLVQDSAFPVEFAGINSILKAGVIWGYVNDASITGTGLGDGDYHLESNSEALGLMVGNSMMLSYDLDGNNRLSGGAAGAYEYIFGANIPVFMNSYRRRI